MVNCFVMPGVTVHVADGAIVADCLFMAPQAESVEVTIGQRTLVHKSLFRAEVDIAEDGIIIDSSFGYSDTLPLIPLKATLGPEAFMYKAALNREPMPKECAGNAEYRSGKRTTIMEMNVEVRKQHLQAGDDFCIAQYIPALKYILTGFTEALPTDNPTPVQNRDDFYRNAVRNLQRLAFFSPTTFGDRCYIGLAVRFEEHRKEQPGNMLVAGNDVNIVVSDTTTSRGRSPYTEKPDTTIRVNVLRLGNGSTLALACPMDCEHRTFHELRVDEKAALIFDAASVDHPSLGYNLHVTKEHAVRL